MRVVFVAILLFLAPPAAAQEKPDAAAFMELLPDMTAETQILMQMVDPNTAGKAFYLGAVSISIGFLGQACRLQLSLRNTMRDGTIDNLTLVLTSHGEYGEKIGVHEFKFRFVDPNYSGSASVSLDRPCLDLAYIRPREVTVCRFDGLRITDCLQELPERRDVDWINRPR